MAKQKAESNALKKCHDHLPSLVRFQTRIYGLKRWPESSRELHHPCNVMTSIQSNDPVSPHRDLWPFTQTGKEGYPDVWDTGFKMSLMPGNMRLSSWYPCQNGSKWEQGGEWSPDQSLAYSVLTKATHTHPVVILLVPKWTNISWQLKKATTQHQLLGLWSRGGGVALTVGRKFGPFRSFNIC